jgi:hypothetical protein
MKTEIKYVGTEEEKQAKAIQDVKDYLDGTDMWPKVKQHSICAASLESLAFELMFVGIQGYPVKALFNEYNK